MIQEPFGALIRSVFVKCRYKWKWNRNPCLHRSYGFLELLFDYFPISQTHNWNVIFSTWNQMYVVTFLTCELRAPLVRNIKMKALYCLSWQDSPSDRVLYFMSNFKIRTAIQRFEGGVGSGHNHIFSHFSLSKSRWYAADGGLPQTPESSSPNHSQILLSYICRGMITLLLAFGKSLMIWKCFLFNSC